MKDLNLTEEMVLWAVWRLKDDAYGVTIRDHLSRETGRRYPYGTLYSALAKLEKLGYARENRRRPQSRPGRPQQELLRITPYGIAALKAALELKTALWDKDSVLALEKS